MEQTGVEVELLGGDGNVFAVIGAVSKALKRAGLADVAKEYRETAMACKSYDEVLQLTMGARRALGLESPRTQTYVGFLAGYRAALRGKR